MMSLLASLQPGTVLNIAEGANNCRMKVFATIYNKKLSRRNKAMGVFISCVTPYIYNIN